MPLKTYIGPFHSDLQRKKEDGEMWGWACSVALQRAQYCLWWPHYPMTLERCRCASFGNVNLDSYMDDIVDVRQREEGVQLGCDGNMRKIDMKIIDWFSMNEMNVKRAKYMFQLTPNGCAQALLKLWNYAFFPWSESKHVVQRKEWKTLWANNKRLQQGSQQRSVWFRNIGEIVDNLMKQHSVRTSERTLQKTLSAMGLISKSYSSQWRGRRSHPW